jgi:hypothetical protein
MGGLITKSKSRCRCCCRCRVVVSDAWQAVSPAESLGGEEVGLVVRPDDLAADVFVYRPIDHVSSHPPVRCPYVHCVRPVLLLRCCYCFTPEFFARPTAGQLHLCYPPSAMMLFTDSLRVSGWVVREGKERRERGATAESGMRNTRLGLGEQDIQLGSFGKRSDQGGGPEPRGRALIRRGEKVARRLTGIRKGDRRRHAPRCVYT